MNDKKLDKQSAMLIEIRKKNPEKKSTRTNPRYTVLECVKEVQWQSLFSRNRTEMESWTSHFCHL